jgi:hypothetical protein
MLCHRGDNSAAFLAILLVLLCCKFFPCQRPVSRKKPVEKAETCVEMSEETNRAFKELIPNETVVVELAARSTTKITVSSRLLSALQREQCEQFGRRARRGLDSSHAPDSRRQSLEFQDLAGPRIWLLV